MSDKKRPNPAVRRLRFLLYALLAAPALWLALAFSQDRLGANPIEKLIHVSGYWTLFILLTTLCITPLKRLSGRQWLMRMRRPLGVAAFGYACLHLLAYAFVDQYFDWQAIGEDILKRPYITLGFAGWLLMAPLAATSTEAMMRRLGGSRWRRLHRLVYLIAIAGVVHFIWLVKKDLTQPLLFAAWLGVLLLARIGFRLLDARKIRRRYAATGTIGP